MFRISLIHIILYKYKYPSRIESGFKKVESEKYIPKLLQVKGIGKCIQANEVPFIEDSINSDDVFIFDLGLKLINWRGSQADLRNFMVVVFVI